MFVVYILYIPCNFYVKVDLFRKELLLYYLVSDQYVIFRTLHKLNPFCLDIKSSPDSGYLISAFLLILGCRSLVSGCQFACPLTGSRARPETFSTARRTSSAGLWAVRLVFIAPSFDDSDLVRLLLIVYRSLVQVCTPLQENLLTYRHVWFAG